MTSSLSRPTSLTKQQQIAHLKEIASNSLRLTVKGAPHLSTIESVHTPSDASGTDSDGRTPTDLMTPRPGLNESGCLLRRGSYFESGTTTPASSDDDDATACCLNDSQVPTSCQSSAQQTSFGVPRSEQQSSTESAAASSLPSTATVSTSAVLSSSSSDVESDHSSRHTTPPSSHRNSLEPYSDSDEESLWDTPVDDAAIAMGLVKPSTTSDAQVEDSDKENEVPERKATRSKPAHSLKSIRSVRSFRRSPLRHSISIENATTRTADEDKSGTSASSSGFVSPQNSNCLPADESSCAYDDILQLSGMSLESSADPLREVRDTTMGELRLLLAKGVQRHCSRCAQGRLGLWIWTWTSELMCTRCVQSASSRVDPDLKQKLVDRNARCHGGLAAAQHPSTSVAKEVDVDVLVRVLNALPTEVLCELNAINEQNDSTQRTVTPSTSPTLDGSSIDPLSSDAPFLEPFEPRRRRKTSTQKLKMAVQTMWSSRSMPRLAAAATTIDRPSSPLRSSPLRNLARARWSRSPETARGPLLSYDKERSELSASSSSVSTSFSPGSPSLLSSKMKSSTTSTPPSLRTPYSLPSSLTPAHKALPNEKPGDSSRTALSPHIEQTFLCLSSVFVGVISVAQRRRSQVSASPSSMPSPQLGKPQGDAGQVRAIAEHLLVCLLCPRGDHPLGTAILASEVHQHYLLVHQGETPRKGQLRPFNVEAWSWQGEVDSIDLSTSSSASCASSLSEQYSALPRMRSVPLLQDRIRTPHRPSSMMFLLDSAATQSPEVTPEAALSMLGVDLGGNKYQQQQQQHRAETADAVLTLSLPRQSEKPKSSIVDDVVGADGPESRLRDLLDCQADSCGKDAPATSPDAPSPTGESVAWQDSPTIRTVAGDDDEEEEDRGAQFGTESDTAGTQESPTVLEDDEPMTYYSCDESVARS